MIILLLRSFIQRSKARKILLQFRLKDFSYIIYCISVFQKSLFVSYRVVNIWMNKVVQIKVEQMPPFIFVTIPSLYLSKKYTLTKYMETLHCSDSRNWLFFLHIAECTIPLQLWIKKSPCYLHKIPRKLYCNCLFCLVIREFDHKSLLLFSVVARWIFSEKSKSMIITFSPFHKILT